MGHLQEGIQRLGYQFVPFLMAVVCHEVGHGLAANWWGDSTAKNAGRLTLNPLPHLDIFGTVLFPIINMLSGMNILFGWARPVPIDPRRFRNYRKGLFYVALAGPASNFLMAFACAFSLCALIRFIDPGFIFYQEFATMLEIGVYINYSLGIFNLLPIPPLDGSKIIESFLSYNAMIQYERIAQYSFWILIALLVSGVLSLLSGPVLYMAHLTLGIASLIFGVNLI